MLKKYGGGGGDKKQKKSGHSAMTIIETYNWQSMIPIGEEPEFGNDLIPRLTYGLQDMDTRVPSLSSIRQNFTHAQITEELDKIKRQANICVCCPYDYGALVKTCGTSKKGRDDE
ncbi:hypothetical protein K1719_013087 [Acacia pycnantha]|nr:hypothetical protein K1719_013087 [Acacia pycnantha]